MNIVRAATAITAINLTILLAGLTWAGSADPAPPTEVLRGRALELVDSSGRIRARLNLEPGGAVVLRLLDSEGTIRVKLGADSDGSGLLLANDATEPGVHLLAKAEGSSVRVVNKDGRERVIAP